MNKITKAQRDQIIAVFMGTAIVIAGLWYGVISGQQEKIAQTRAQTEKMRSKVSQGTALIGKETEIRASLEACSRDLADKEASMAPERDTYAWMLNTIKPMALSHRGVTFTVSQPEPITDMNLLPRFFYKTAVFHVKGIGHFNDLGSFLADFENGFPYFRIQGMDIMPSSISGLVSGAGEISSPGAQPGALPDAENLDFRFDIVVPVKPADSVPLTK